MMMLVTPAVRRKAFLAALSVSGDTVVSVARDMGLSPNHLRLCLKGQRRSSKLDLELDAYVARVLLPFVDEYRRRTAAER